MMLYRYFLYCTYQFFFRYALKGCLISEFSSSRYDICAEPDVTPCPPDVGTIEETAFEVFHISQPNSWLWGGLVSWWFVFGKKCNAKYDTVQSDWIILRCFVLLCPPGLYVHYNTLYRQHPPFDI